MLARRLMSCSDVVHRTRVPDPVPWRLRMAGALWRGRRASHAPQGLDAGASGAGVYLAELTIVLLERLLSAPAAARLVRLPSIEIGRFV